MSATDKIETAREAWLDLVRRKVNTMRFGSVQIVVHEGWVTQVEITEKTRLAGGEPAKTIAPGRA